MEHRRTITYNLDDFKRYKLGLMSKEEMHALEKASMEDPFLADALEGFMEADHAVAEKHSEEISRRVTEENNDNREAVVVPMPRRNFGWWRVAAMVIVVAGAGMLTYKMFNTPGPGGKTGGTGIATVQPKPTDTQVASLKKDTALNSYAGAGIANFSGDTVAPRVIAALPVKHRVKITQQQPPRTFDTDQSYTTQQSDLAARGEESKKANEKASLDEVTVNKTAAPVSYSLSNNGRPGIATNNEFRGVILTASNQPLANANIRLDNSRKETVTDKLGNFTFKADDSVVNAIVSSSGYNNTRVQLRSGTNNTINLGTIRMQNDSSLDVTVTAVGMTRKAKTGDTIAIKPEGGWESFQQYVATKLKKQVDTTGRDMKITGGELQLEFYVDGNGIPKDFKILSSTDASINDQAIDAVKKGPKWATRNKKARILIRF